MKKTYFILKNQTGSAGMYLLNDEYKFLNPGETITLDSKPTCCTAQITISMFRKEITNTKILNKKPQIISENVQKEGD